MHIYAGFIDIVMSDIMIELLNNEDEDLLRNAICSIRSMGSIGQCQDELISDEVFSRVACIIETYSHDELLVRNSLAVLAVFSYNEESHPCLAVKDVMQVLFRMTRDCKDILARVLIATTLCNMSISHKSRVFMLEKGLIEALGVLSGTTNEQIQELCATCLCNLTSSLPLQKQLVKNSALDLLMVIALVRSTATHTKQLCARALLNLFNSTDVIPTLRDCDALRIFAGLSSISHVPTQVICARGFLTLTGSETWRRDLIEMPILMQALLNMINSPSEEARLMIGIAVCNLLVCPFSQPILIKYSGLDVLNVLSVSTVDDIKEAIVESLFSLINIPTLQPVMISESAVNILLYFLQDTNDRVFDTSLHTLYQMAKNPGYRLHMLEANCASVLVSLVVQGDRLVDNTDNTDITKQARVIVFAERCCQILCLLSYADIKCASLVENSKVMIAFHILYTKRLSTVKIGTYLAAMLRNLSSISDLCVSLVESKCVALLGNMFIEMFQQGAAQEILLTRRCLLPLLHNICKEVSLQPEVLRQGLMELLTIIMLNKTDIKELEISERKVSRVVLTTSEIMHVASTIQLVTQTVSCHSSLLESDCIRILHLLSNQININDDAKHEIACAISKLSATRNPTVKALLTQQGASEILTPIAKTTRRPDTQKQCLLALGYLSNASRINSGAVSSLLHIASGIGTGKDSATTTTDADMLHLERIGEEFGIDSKTARLTQRSNSSEGTKRGGSAGSKLLLVPNFSTPIHSSGGSTRIGGGKTDASADKATEIIWTQIEKSNYKYNIIFIPIETELAGKANEVSFPNLSLPKATTRTKEETDERSAQLAIPPLPTAPMAKDMTEVSLETDFQAQREDTEEVSSEMSDTFESKPSAGLHLDISNLSETSSGKKSISRRSLLARKKSSNSPSSFRLMSSARSARSNLSGSSDQPVSAAQMMMMQQGGSKTTSRRNSILSTTSLASHNSTPVILNPINQGGSSTSRERGETQKIASSTNSNLKPTLPIRAASCFL